VTPPTDPRLRALFVRKCEDAIRDGGDPWVVWLKWRKGDDVDADELREIVRALTGGRRVEEVDL
jgi:hypothetical protein